MVGLHLFHILIDLVPDIQINQCYEIFDMIMETLRTDFHNDQIHVNGGFISKIIILVKELLIFHTTGTDSHALITDSNSFTRPFIVFIQITL